jgi:hypothetical protein
MVRPDFLISWRLLDAVLNEQPWPVWLLRSRTSRGADPKRRCPGLRLEANLQSEAGLLNAKPVRRIVAGVAHSIRGVLRVNDRPRRIDAIGTVVVVVMSIVVAMVAVVVVAMVMAMMVTMMPVAVIGVCAGREQSAEAKSQSGDGNQSNCNAFHVRDPFKTFKREGEGWVVNRFDLVQASTHGLCHWGGGPMTNCYEP